MTRAASTSPSSSPEQAVTAAERLHGPDAAAGGGLPRLPRRRSTRSSATTRRRCSTTAAPSRSPSGSSAPIIRGSASIATTWRRSTATLGSYDDALRYQNRDLEIALASLGPEHPDTGLSYTNRGTLRIESGRHAEGLLDLQRADAIYARSLAPDHPDRLALDHNLGAILVDLGRLDEAERHLQRSLVGSLATLGPDHPAVAYADEGLGRVATLRGDFAIARVHLDRGLAIREATLGPDHIDVVDALSGLALWWDRQGRCDQALPLIRRGQAVLHQQLHTEHLYNVLLDGHLARCSPPDDPTRLAGLERAVAGLHHRGPPRDRAELILDLADALVGAGQLARARTLATEAAALLATTGPGHARERDRAARWLAEHPATP
jgi:tetratricopeptide (TPR) repeat protein